MQHIPLGSTRHPHHSAYEEPFQFISFDEVINFLRNWGVAIICALVVGSLSGYCCSRYVPKQFKVRASFNIQPGYFHLPPVSDSLGGIQDTAELSAQRAALVRIALSDQFIESLARRYLFSSEELATQTMPLDLDVVSKRIEYFPTNLSTFQISIRAATAQMAFTGTQETLAHIIEVLQAHRRQRLMNAQRALVQEASVLQQTLLQGILTGQNGSLQAQLNNIESRLSALQERFAETHPEIRHLERRLESLRGELQSNNAPATSNTSDVLGVFQNSQARAISAEIVGDLLKGISSISVALNSLQGPAPESFVEVVEQPRLPAGPISPNPVQFALIGGAFGGLITLAFAIRRELSKRPVPRSDIIIGVDRVG